MVSFLNSIDDEKKAVMKMEIRYKKAESEREQCSLNNLIKVLVCYCVGIVCLTDYFMFYL